jgi:hypothetical protein
VFDVEDGGGAERRDGAPRAVIVVKSAEEVEAPTEKAEKALATAVQRVFERGEIEGWALAASPSRYETVRDEQGREIRRLRRPPEPSQSDTAVE